MPIMTRMRDSMPVILFGLLLAFLITIIFEWGMDYLGTRGGGRSDVVGSVNGKKIKYQEFSELLKNFTESRKTQAGQEPGEEETRQARDQVWQSLVTQHLLTEEMHRLGITVTDQELVDWVRGENPPEDLRRSFIDSTGQFRRDVFEQFLSDPNQFVRDPQGRDPDFGKKWLKNYEDGLRQRRMQEKLQSLVTATVRVSEGDVRQRYEEQNTQLTTAYAFFDPAVLVQDADVQVSDADLRAYYDENLDQYRLEASRTLKYVTLLEKASAADTALRVKDMQDAAGKARAGADFLQLVSTYSDRQDTGAFFKHGELETALEGPVFAARTGEVVGPIEDAEGLHLFKVLGERAASGEYIRASHILLPMEGQDTVAVRAQAAAVVREARSGSAFAGLAEKYSKDPGSARRGGDLGWFTRGRMVPAFEKAAFAARPGEIVGPVRSPFGLHIIKVTGRDNREVQLAHILMRITPSPQTKNDLADRSRDFAYNAGETDFTRAANEVGFEVRETQIQEKGGVVPGIGINESITRWAFSNKVGKVSEPFTITNGFAVFTIAAAHDAGVRPFDEVKASLQPVVLRTKKLARARGMAQELRAKLGANDSLAAVSRLNPAITVQTAGPFAVTGIVPGVGRDPFFLGAASALKPGQISNAVQGQRGAFLIQLLNRTPFDSTGYAVQREALRGRLLQERKSRFLSDWLEKLKANADITDHRDQFFR